ncbi:MAG: helicase [Muribaculaceae bacterium]|nr:helicase [Muribaculaceae bacterium]
MALIYDNIEQQFSVGLKNFISENGVKRVDFCVGYFNLRGWNLVMNEVEALPGDWVDERGERVHRVCRLLIGMHQPQDELTRWLYDGRDHTVDSNFAREQKLKIAADFRRQLLLGLPSRQDEVTLQRLSAQMKDGKVCVKLYVRHPLHAKLYLMHLPDSASHPVSTLMGSSNLTYSGLTGNGELDASIDERDNGLKLARWFDDRWDDNFCIDITRELIEVIDTSWASEKTIPPYYIYLKMAYHLCEDARNGIKEFTLSPEFARELFPFQQEAVKIAAHHLRNEKRGGAMIGDVVGLGKTITACAIAKIYETTFASSTLIICPANLQTMWQGYARKYDLKVDIMSMAKPIDVDNARYYRLVIIDESHNLRNGASGQRYNNIKELIDRQDCNVLLLTATPYNKDYRDMSNQLRLFIDADQDLGIRPEHYIREIGGERVFMQRHDNVTHIRSIAAFEKSDKVEDWNELMKLFLVRRTRTFIKNNYAETDAATGRKYLAFPDGRRSYFPDREPHSIKFTTEPGDQYNRLYSTEMIAMMDALELPRYGLSAYVSEARLSEATKLESATIENLSRAGARMVGICKSTFFKRIDSSGFAFLLTIYRHILRNMVFVYALDNKLQVPVSDNNTLPDEVIDDEGGEGRIDGLDTGGVDGTGEQIVIPVELEHYRQKAGEYYNMLAGKTNVKWLSPQLFRRTLKTKLLADCEMLLKMLRHCGAWVPANDRKLNELEQLLTSTHGDDKVVVFTQYSDTAQYIYRELRRRGMQRLEVVTGDSDDPTAIVERFSPVSNGKGDMPAERQLRVVVATDVLSEGQNLQDSHIVVNYDLPWAIIRLIQRAGRVDRIGQTADRIDCYSFFPAEGVETVIELRKRLNERINANAQVVGSDEKFFEGNEQNLRDMYNEKSGVLDDDEDADVDLTSQAFQIWKHATAANPELARIIPALSNMIYSTKEVPLESDGGVVTYVRTANDFDLLTWLDGEGRVVSQSQSRILQALECTAATAPVEPLSNHHELQAMAVERARHEQAAAATGNGMLGRHFSTRHRIVDLLDNYYGRGTNLFFNKERKQELKLAIDDLYNYQLRDTAKLALGQMLRRRASADDIVDYVLMLRREGNLCRQPAEGGDSREPVIVCSMGMRPRGYETASRNTQPFSYATSSRNIQQTND